MINLYTTSGKRLPATSVGEILGLGFLIANILLVLIKNLAETISLTSRALYTEVGISRGWAPVLIAGVFLVLWFMSSYAIGRLFYRMGRTPTRRSAGGQSDAGED